MKSYRLLFLCIFLLSVVNAQWIEQNSGVTSALYTVSAPSDLVCWIGGASGVVLRTVDGGSTWTNVGGVGISNQDVYAISAYDSNFCHITTSTASGTYIYQTTNGGITWVTQLYQAGGFGNGIWFNDYHEGIFIGDPVGGRWTIFRTTNAGAQWDSTGLYLPSEGLAGWNNSLFVYGNKVWFGTNGSKIWYSSDFGTSWTARQTSGEVNTFAIWFNRDYFNVGLSGGSNFIRSLNYGESWGSIGVPGTGNVSGITGYYWNWYVTRQSTSIFKATNNVGNTWETTYTAPAGNYNHIRVAKQGFAVYGVRSNGGITKGFGTVVPVELASFTATSNEGSVVLDWSTATETNNQGFTIERKVAGGEYAAIAFVEGNGSSTTTRNYSFTDGNLQAGKYSYRLKQTDFDGTSAYSKEVEVDVAQVISYALDQNFPNPFNPETVIRFALPVAGNVDITVYNSLGQKVMTLFNGQREAGYHQVTFNAENFPSGSYIYTIKAGNFTATRKMMLMK